MSGGIQADTNKDTPQWIHSGEPGTTGREPFDDDSTGVPREHNHERQHHGHHGQHDQQTGAGYDNNSREGYGSGLTGAGLGASGYDNDRTGGGLTGATTGEHHHSHHHHHQNQGAQGISDETLGRSGVTGERGYDNTTSGSGLGSGGATGGQGYGGYKDFDNNPSFGQDAARTGSGNNSSSNTFDRVGDRNEGGALYERTGNQGPATTGAAGTDRFDTDKHRGTTGLQGRDVGTGNQRGVGDVSEDSAYERTGGGELGATSGSGGAAGTNTGPTTGTGGALSGLTTTDDEFTGKDRSHTGPNIATSGGAYEDTSGPFKSNTSGPGGNTALTGREGTTEKNPVAQATSTGGASGEPTGRVGQEEQTEHKGFVQKIKDML